MRESLMYGSVRGARGNSRPYRDAAVHMSTCGTKEPTLLCPEGLLTELLRTRSGIGPDRR